MIALLALILLLATSALAQPPQVVWTRTIGGAEDDRSYCVDTTVGGGFVLGGFTESFGSGERAFYLVRTDSVGDTLWTRAYASHGGACRALAQTEDGFLLAGEGWREGADLPDFLVVRTNSTGDSLWSRRFGGASYDGCKSICLASDGDFVLAGGTESFGAGASDGWLLKMSPAGDSLWSRTYGTTGTDYFSCVRPTADGGFIAVGATGPSGGDGWAVRTNAQGDTTWTATLGDAYHDEFHSVVEDPQGNFAVVGEWGPYPVACMFKLSASGVLLRGSYYLYNWWNRLYSVSLHPGGYIAVGSAGTPYNETYGLDCLLIRFSLAGDSAWSSLMRRPGWDEAYSVAVRRDGSFAVAGYAIDTESGDLSNCFLMGMSGETPWRNIQVDPLFVNFGRVAVGDSATMPIHLSNLGTLDVTIGELDCPEHFGTDLAAPFVLPAGARRDLGVTFYPVATGAQTDSLFILCDAPQCPVGIRLLGLGVASAVDPSDALASSFYLAGAAPNPFNSRTRIAFGLGRTALVDLAVFDITGRRVASLVSGHMEAGQHELVFDGGDLPSGVYLIHIEAGSFSQTAKMMLVK